MKFHIFLIQKIYVTPILNLLTNIKEECTVVQPPIFKLNINEYLFLGILFFKNKYLYKLHTFKIKIKYLIID